MADESARADPTVSPSLDHLFRILSDPRRRFVLGHLKSNPYPIPVARLAEAVAIYELNDLTRESTETELRRIQTSLRHVHLPSLADAGLIRWNRERDVVVLSKHAGRMPVLSQLDERRLETALIGTCDAVE